MEEEDIRKKEVFVPATNNLIGFKKYKVQFKCFLDSVWIKSLNHAAKEQNLNKLSARLEEIVPDIKHQYSTFELNTPYLILKVRNQHAFQISLIEEIINEFDNPVIVDIGDSAGTHLQYILSIYKNKNIECLGVNLDTKAIDRIKAKGLNAIYARAEDLNKYNVNADIFLCFEMIEHLIDPFHFLHELSSKTQCKYLVITVPYLKKSRVGLHHIRSGRKDDICAENTHIFELDPEDWKLIVQHTGWKVVKERIYYQYPRKHLLWITKYLWRKFDFEGFYGLILMKDDAWSSKYKDW